MRVAILTSVNLEDLSLREAMVVCAALSKYTAGPPPLNEDQKIAMRLGDMMLAGGIGNVR